MSLFAFSTGISSQTGSSNSSCSTSSSLTRPTPNEPEVREIGLQLQAVTWHVLNEKNANFNRNSLVLYALEKLPDGSIKEHGYAFTDPAADRIGNNMKWMLVNCALVPRDQARPEM